MLVLSRRKDESIIVGNDIEIMVVGIRRNEIQLGINAPRSVPVFRKEVYGRICRELNNEDNRFKSLHRRHNYEMAVKI